MTRNLIVAAIVAIVVLAFPVVAVVSWTGAASARLDEQEATASERPQAGVAQEANESYCTPELKRILRRVLRAAGSSAARAGAAASRSRRSNVATMERRRLQRAVPPDEGPRRDHPVRASVRRARRGRRDSSSIASSPISAARATSSSCRARRPRARPSQPRAQHAARRGRDGPPRSETFNDPDLAATGRPALARRGVRPARSELLRLAPQRQRPQLRPDDLNRSAFIAWIDCRL